MAHVFAKLACLMGDFVWFSPSITLTFYAAIFIQPFLCFSGPIVPNWQWGTSRGPTDLGARWDGVWRWIQSTPFNNPRYNHGSTIRRWEFLRKTSKTGRLMRYDKWLRYWGISICFIYWRRLPNFCKAGNLNKSSLKIMQQWRKKLIYINTWSNTPLPKCSNALMNI